MTERAVAKTGRSTGLHYRRTFWLLVIGLIHAHIIWSGDILVAYAVCGFFVYLFRKAKPQTLVILGVLTISVHTLFYLFLGTSIEHWPPESMEMAKQAWIPSAEFQADEIAKMTGPLSEQISHNSSNAIFMETAILLMIFIWQVIISENLISEVPCRR